MRLMFACLVPLLAFLGCASEEKKAPAEKAPAAAEKTPETAKKAPEKKPMPTRPADAKVFFTWPDDGAKVPPTFDMLFGTKGVDVVPAGTAPGDPTKGHHHVIVDAQAMGVGMVVPPLMPASSMSGPTIPTGASSSLHNRRMLEASRSTTAPSR